MKMLRLEFDLQHHLVLSRRLDFDHAIIRLILSALATPEEIANLSKSNLKFKDEVFSVQLSGVRKRISPIDEKTYHIIMRMEKERPFELNEEEIDSIVAKYSPKDKKYTAKSLRSAMITFLKDASLFDLEFEKLSQKELFDFMLDFNPVYSGTWLDEEGLQEFVLNYSSLNNLSDPKVIAKELALDEKFVAEVIKSGKSIFSLTKRFNSEKFIF
ncbi:MAG: hypothetical protein QXN34_05505 [Archaeoglobaceae archaeon]